MTGELRVRRHTDGRLAIKRSDDEPWQFAVAVSEADMTTEGWTELLVTKLPEPDGWTDAVDDSGEDVKTPLWRLSFGTSVTDWIEGVETPVWELREDLDKIRADALKMLAAVATCERYRAEAGQ